MFLTPHVVRTRDDLRSLALDERQKFTDSLGRREMHQMPMQQYKQLYQPTFSIPVSPAQDLKDRGSTMAPISREWRPALAAASGRSPSSMMAPASRFLDAAQYRRDRAEFQGGAVKPAPWMTAPPPSSTTVDHSAVDHRLDGAGRARGRAGGRAAAGSR